MWSFYKTDNRYFVIKGDKYASAETIQEAIHKSTILVTKGLIFSNYNKKQFLFTSETNDLTKIKEEYPEYFT